MTAERVCTSFFSADVHRKLDERKFLVTFLDGHQRRFNSFEEVRKFTGQRKDILNEAIKKGTRLVLGGKPVWIQTV